MADGAWKELVEQLRGAPYEFGLIAPESRVYRVELDDGLTDAEIAAVEARFEFRFPPDLREFLQTALPRGPEFPDWRAGNENELHMWLDQPRRGVLFDVENGFWLPEWGKRPRGLDVRGAVNNLVAAAPKLIPVYAHRMMPDEPHEAGNPVFSVHQTDVIHYSFDLADYLRAEFNLPGREPWPEQIRRIRFWDVERFQGMRWGADGGAAFDNSRGMLP